MPKNTGLESFKKEINIDGNIIKVRGEDVPLWVAKSLVNGQNAIGITGEDLYYEFCLKQDIFVPIIKTVQWDDQTAMFGKPALCLMGNTDKIPNQNDLTVFIPRKYRTIANNYLKRFNRNFSKVYVSGCVETSCNQGIADLVIDIVYTGASQKKYNLQIIEKIFESNYVVIGGSK